MRTFTIVKLEKQTLSGTWHLRLWISVPFTCVIFGKSLASYHLFSHLLHGVMNTALAI